MPRMAAWCFTTDEVVHVTKDIPGDGDESNKENMIREERDSEVHPDDNSYEWLSRIKHWAEWT